MCLVAPFTLIPSPETTELAADIRALFDELASSLRREQRASSGEWRPPLDVFETATTVEVIVDVSGVPREAVRVLFRAGVLIVAGEKAPLGSGPAQTYHLVEREFGRFARAVRLSEAFDMSRSRATLRDGELSIVLPTLTERRGAAHPIAITTAERAAP